MSVHKGVVNHSPPSIPRAYLGHNCGATSMSDILPERSRCQRATLVREEPVMGMRAQIANQIIG